MVDTLGQSISLTILPDMGFQILLIIYSAPISLIKSEFLITVMAYLNFDFHILEYDMQIVRYASVFTT